MRYYLYKITAVVKNINKMSTKEVESSQLTCIIGGADSAFATCPELEVTYFADSDNEAREGLWNIMSGKANAILEASSEYPFKELITPAKLLIENLEQAHSALLKGERILVSPSDNNQSTKS